jgi:hypothetical protein
MGVTYELIDAPYPSLCAVYRCRCGATETRYGADASTPPAGWDVDPDPAEPGGRVRCPGCRLGDANPPNGERDAASG